MYKRLTRGVKKKKNGKKSSPLCARNGLLFVGGRRAKIIIIIMNREMNSFSCAFSSFFLGGLLFFV